MIPCGLKFPSGPAGRLGTSPVNLWGCCCHCVSPAETRRRVCCSGLPFPLATQERAGPALRPFSWADVSLPAGCTCLSAPRPGLHSLPTPPSAVLSNWPQPRSGGHPAGPVEFGVSAPWRQHAGLGSAASWPRRGHATRGPWQVGEVFTLPVLFVVLVKLALLLLALQSSW